MYLDFKETLEALIDFSLKWDRTLTKKQARDIVSKMPALFINKYPIKDLQELLKYILIFRK